MQTVLSGSGISICFASLDVTADPSHEESCLLEYNVWHEALSLMGVINLFISPVELIILADNISWVHMLLDMSPAGSKTF